MSYEEDDGLGSFDLSQLGMKTGAFGGARIMKYVQGNFITREGEPIESTREFISLGLTKVVQKFVGKKLMDTIVIGVHEDFPDLDKMNDEAPREEWGTGLDGKPQGPYSRVLVLKLLDATTMDRFAFITQSVGGSIAIGDLSAKCKIRRQLQGPHVAPVVSCFSTLFKTSYNPHGKRPDFRVIRWIELKGDRALAKPTEPPKLVGGTTAVAPSAPEIKEAPPIGTPVKDPSLQEEMQDHLPF